MIATRLLLLSWLLWPAALPAAGPALAFRETAAAWGLDFRHHHGGSGERYMVETMVGGVVILDYDGDGDEDVFFVDGGVLPGYEGETPRSRLYRNESTAAATAGGKRFVDVTADSGITVDDYGAGAAAADVDGDGDLDLYVTAFGQDQLFLSQGDGSFVDATAQAGLEDPRWSAGAAFADYDGDGDLDLYVSSYVDFALDNLKFCGRRDLGLRGYCHPAVYNGLRDRLYRNRGDGTFEDVTLAAGLESAIGAGLGVAWSDLTHDGWPDVYVANDMTPNLLFENRGDGTFDDLSLLSGTAYSDRGSAEAGMGVAVADVDGNGLFDLAVTNFELETNALYANQGAGLFLDHRFAAGLAEPSLLKLAFGLAFADFDHDGDEDLVIANGHINDNAAELQSETPYRQANQLFENVGGRFREVEAGLDVVRASRGLAVGDLDGDGDRDVVIINSNDLAEVYENRGAEPGSFLEVLLRQRGDNRFAVGAHVELQAAHQAEHQAGKSVARREVRAGSSYLSQNALGVHFGLGGAVRAGELRIRWPGGRRLTVRGLPAGRRVRIDWPRMKAADGDGS